MTGFIDTTRAREIEFQELMIAVKVCGLFRNSRKYKRSFNCALIKTWNREYIKFSETVLSTSSDYQFYNHLTLN